MITLNGKKFARTEKEFINTLFRPGGTPVGFYKPNKRTVTLYDHQKNKIGIINAYGVIAKSTRLDNGKWRYSYALPTVLDDDNYTLQQQDDDVREISLTREYKNGEIVHTYL